MWLNTLLLHLRSYTLGVAKWIKEPDFDYPSLYLDPYLSWLEDPAHNRSVVGSSPTGSISSMIFALL